MKTACYSGILLRSSLWGSQNISLWLSQRQMCMPKLLHGRSNRNVTISGIFLGCVLKSWATGLVPLERKSSHLCFSLLACVARTKLLGSTSEREPGCRVGPWILKSNQQLEFVLTFHNYTHDHFFYLKIFVAFLLRHNSHDIHSSFFRALSVDK